jgi:hypothetical protein
VWVERILREGLIPPPSLAAAGSGLEERGWEGLWLVCIRPRLVAIKGGGGGERSEAENGRGDVAASQPSNGGGWLFVFSSQLVKTKISLRALRFF